MPAFAWDTAAWQTLAEDVAKKLAGQIKGKTVLTTGVSPNSLGLAFAQYIAPHAPKMLVLASRSADKLKECEAELRRDFPHVATRKLVLDLADFDQVRRAGAEVMAWDDVPVLDVLCNSAGIALGGDARHMVQQARSAGSIEKMFATNHLGHFLFTKLVLPKLEAAAREKGQARIVNVSSRGHTIGEVRFDDINFEQEKDTWGPPSAFAAYGQSKTANILFSVALADRLRSRNITAFSMHPGSVFTEFVRNMTTEEMAARGWCDKDRKPTDSEAMHWKTVSQGTATHVVSCFDPSITERSGSYLQDTMIETEDVKAYALDKDNADRLWTLSEELVGEKFDT